MTTLLFFNLNPPVFYVQALQLQLQSEPIFPYLLTPMNTVLTKQESAMKFSSKQTLLMPSYHDKSIALVSLSWPTDNSG